MQAERYHALLELAEQSGQAVAEYLRNELPEYWQREYRTNSGRPTEIYVFTYGTFDYIFDTYQPDEMYDPLSGVPPIEARLVAAIGQSNPKSSNRDDGRLRGWPIDRAADGGGPWDKGHFIGHSIGGAIDGCEANAFRQLRSVNRGRYRTMESYCRRNPGILCFSRPVYEDVSAMPVQIEFGILKADGQLWVELHSNLPGPAATERW